MNETVGPHMRAIEFHGWKLRCDRPATRQAYAQLDNLELEASVSAFSRNFSRAVEEAFPAEAKELFDQLGVDYKHFGDLWIPSKVGSTQYHYHGVLHFAGLLEDSSKAEDPVRLGRNFCISFSVGDYAPGPIVSTLRNQNTPVVQIDFETIVPWRISDPFPENLEQLPPDFECGKFWSKARNVPVD